MRRIPLRVTAVLAFALAAACGDDDPTGPPVVTITSPATVTGISGATDSQKLYRIVVPAGATRLTVNTSGGTGNVDLFVQKIRAPRPSDQTDCESFGLTNAESCVYENPTADNYYILLFGSTPYSNVTLNVTITMP